jgi:ketosteroid isomerase-like protein
MTVTRAHAEAWLARYGEAWTGGDPDRAASLFSDDCRYFETPFSEPEVGRAGVRRYWQAVPDLQRDVEFGFRVLAVDGDEAIAHWTASFVRASSGARVALDGMFLLEFDDQLACRTLREWWHRDEDAG